MGVVGNEGSGELSPGCSGCMATMAGGRGVAGDAGADDVEQGLALRDDSASAMVLGDHRALACFLSASAPARGPNIYMSSEFALCKPCTDALYKLKCTSWTSGGGW